MLTAPSKDVVLGASLVLSLVSLVLLFGVTCYLQSSLDLLQQQVEDDRGLLLKLQEKIDVSLSNLVITAAAFLVTFTHAIVIML